MDRGDELITLVVHTEDHALKLKEVLEFHGIQVTLEDVVCAGMPLQVPPKKVRIPVSSLSLGLKILESGEATIEPLALMKMTGMGSTLLIPVDFTPMSDLAVKVGFYLAEKFRVEPVVMHAFIAPKFLPGDIEYTPLTADEGMELGEEEEAVETDTLRKQASTSLSMFKKKIIAAQHQGRLPSIKFSTSLLEGIPEQVIQEYCKENRPAMVIMATRDTHKKGADLVGSVTAEVIDSCRVPIITLPEGYHSLGVDRIKRVAFFCTFTSFDTLTMRWLMRSFDYPAASFYLIPAGDRPVLKIDQKLDDLRKYYSKIYPTAEFHVCGDMNGKFDDRVKKLLEENDIQLIIVPNKKSSAFSRFFRPTLAHKILYEKDVPLIVLPQ